MATADLRIPLLLVVGLVIGGLEAMLPALVSLPLLLLQVQQLLSSSSRSMAAWMVSPGVGAAVGAASRKELKADLPLKILVVG